MSSITVPDEDLHLVKYWYSCPFCRGYAYSIPELKNHVRRLHSNIPFPLPRNLPPGALEGKIYFYKMDNQDKVGAEAKDQMAESKSKNVDSKFKSEQENLSCVKLEVYDKSKAEQEISNCMQMETYDIRIKNVREIMETSSDQESLLQLKFETQESTEGVEQEIPVAPPLASSDSGINDASSKDDVCYHHSSPLLSTLKPNDLQDPGPRVCLIRRQSETDKFVVASYEIDGSKSVPEVNPKGKGNGKSIREDNVTNAKNINKTDAESSISNSEDETQATKPKSKEGTNSASDRDEASSEKEPLFEIRKKIRTKRRQAIGKDRGDSSTEETNDNVPTPSEDVGLNPKSDSTARKKAGKRNRSDSGSSDSLFVPVRRVRRRKKKKTDTPSKSMGKQNESEAATTSISHACPKCKFTCASANDLIQHMKDIHNELCQTKICGYCQKTFTRTDAFNRHIRVHLTKERVAEKKNLNK